MNPTLPAGLQVGQGDGRVREADLFAFFIPRVAVLFRRNSCELLGPAAIRLSFLSLIPVTAVFTCGGRWGLSTTRERLLSPDKLVPITHELLPPLVQHLSCLECDFLRVFLDRFDLPLPSVAEHAVLVDLHRDKHEIS